MKRLAMAMAVAFGLAAMAQEPAEAVGRPDLRHGPRRPGAAERGAFKGGKGGEVPRDPAVAAVLNPKVAEKIGLSEEIREKIKAIDADSRKTIRDLQRKVREVVDRQAELMKATNIDEAAVMSTIDELFVFRKEMAKAQTKRLIAIKSLLSPEQIEKALTVMDELRTSRQKKPAVAPGSKATAPKSEAKAKEVELSED